MPDPAVAKKPAPAHKQQPKPAADKRPGAKPAAPKKPAAKPEAVKPKPKRDLADPKVMNDKETGKAQAEYGKNTTGAQLYGPGGVTPLDVRQGAIADCFFAAAISAAANANPDAITKAIKDNGDGTYRVRFFEIGFDGKATTHFETVDDDLAKSGDVPTYAKSTEVLDGKEHQEMWPGILEKAYAAWKGSYTAIGNGGSSGDVLEALTGKRAKTTSTAGPGKNDALWDKMKKGSDEKKPMTAGSGDKDDAKYKDPKAGVYGWHAYTIMGVEEQKNGDKSERMVILRNPWAKRRRDADATAVGDANNAKDGGVFKLSWDEFRRLYDDVTVGGGD